MASPPPFTTGTVTLENGSAEIIGNGTGWMINGVRGGLMTVEVAGANTLVIDSVDDEDAATAATKWMGPSGTYNYAISMASADAADTLWASRHWSRVVGQALLSAIPFKASGTAAERDALNPPLENGEWFGLAEPGSEEIIAQLKVPGGWRNFTTKGPGGVGAGGLGLPSPGAAGKLPYYLGPNTIGLGDLTAQALTFLAGGQVFGGQLPGRLREVVSVAVVADCDDITETGWYWAPQGTLHAPDGATHCYIDAKAQNGNVAQKQFAYEVNSHREWTRTAWYGGFTTWEPTSGLPGVIGSAGYQMFASGLILQWGKTSTSTDTNGHAPVIFPMTFPNDVLVFLPVNGNQNASVVAAISVGTGADSSWVNTSQAFASFRPNPGVGPATVNWIALGY